MREQTNIRCRRVAVAGTPTVLNRIARMPGKGGGRSLFGALLWATTCLGGLVGCGEIFTDQTPAIGNGSAVIGEACGTSGDCRDGLLCDEGTCQARGDQGEGGRCTASVECAEGLYCSLLGVCEEEGSGALGEGCADNSGCQADLYCEYLGFTGSCQPVGEGDIGADCEGGGDCLGGLGCGETGTCIPGLPASGIAFFGGVACDEAADDDPFEAYFNVPRTGQEPGHFYELPFPNDIRRGAGGIDMAGHPAPELDTVGNIVATMLSLIEEDVDGYGVHQATFFRFSHFPDQSTLTSGGTEPTIYVVNIDPESSRYAQKTALRWYATSADGRFICDNWLAIRPTWTQPYQASTTYAAIVTTGIRRDDGQAPAVASDFTAVMGAGRPADPDLAAAWDTYQPFREYLNEQGIAASTIAAAAVFTTGDPTSRFEGLPGSVQAFGAPANEDLSLCQDNTISPCDDGLTADEHVRACFGESDDYHEIHTRVEIPVYQQGEAPYLTDGGGLLFDSDGGALLQRTEAVCTSITVPKGSAMPATGWPVVVYAHGTGGNFRGHIDGLAGELASLGYASIGFDGVAHGARRGDSTDDPSVLFFNVLNPRAAGGNVLQGAADILSYGLFAEHFDLPAEASPTTGAIRFDPDHLVVFGHSQGATVASVALAGEHNYDAAVLSGAGGGLLLSLLGKTEPIDIAGGIELVLGESVTDMHPILNLIQMYFEFVDPLNFAPRLVAERPEGLSIPHLFQTWGVGDSYTPDDTIDALISELDLPIMTPAISDDLSQPTVDPPVTGNMVGGTVTAVAGQYEPPAGVDGHFVIFDNFDAHAQLLGFLESLLTDDPPTVPAPPE